MIWNVIKWKQKLYTRRKTSNGFESVLNINNCHHSAFVTQLIKLNLYFFRSAQNHIVHKHYQHSMLSHYCDDMEMSTSKRQQFVLVFSFVECHIVSIHIRSTVTCCHCCCSAVQPNEWEFNRTKTKPKQIEIQQKLLEYFQTDGKKCAGHSNVEYAK